MINIISKAIYKRKTTGPKKVVTNLILSLEKAGVPYVINRSTDVCKNIWIQDSAFLLKKISNNNTNLNIIAGPNIFVNPEEIDPQINLQQVTYLTPSSPVEKNWRQRGYKLNNFKVWPAGIDTDTYKPNSEKTRSKVLLYFKKRGIEDLSYAKDLLLKKGINFEVITYGSYKQDDYKKNLEQTKYIFWVGCYESQGIALQEAMSCDVPILIWDIAVPVTVYDSESTSAPYFDERCGHKTKDKDNLDRLLGLMEESWQTMHPREYVLENLSLEKSLQIFSSFLVKESAPGEKAKGGHIIIEIITDEIKTIFQKIVYRIKKGILKLLEQIQIKYFKRRTKNISTITIKNGQINN